MRGTKKDIIIGCKRMRVVRMTPDIRNTDMIENWAEIHERKVGVQSFDELLFNMECGTPDFLCRLVKGIPLSKEQSRQSEIVALHVARAAYQMVGKTEAHEIGVVINGRDERVCESAPRG